MTKSEFRELYKQSLFEACDEWPEEFLVSWRTVPEDKINSWLDLVMSSIPYNGVVMTNKMSSFAILCKKLGVRHTAKNIQAALAACTPDPVVSDQPASDPTADVPSNMGDGR